MTAVTAAEPGRARSMTPARALRHALTLAWRSLVRIRRNPEQLLDVTLQPIVFVTLFVFLFGGAIKGESRHTYLEYVLPGIMVMTVVFASMGTGIGLNTDVTKGIFDRFRSLPISRSAPLTGTIMGDFVRYVVSVAMVFAYGSLLGFRIATNPLSALGAVGTDVRLRLCRRLDLGAPRPVREVPAEPAGIRVHRHVPARVREQRVHPDQHPARLAASLGQGQPGDRAGQRQPRPDAGRTGRDPGVALHRLEHRDHRRLRAAGGTPVPPHRLAGPARQVLIPDCHSADIGASAGRVEDRLMGHDQDMQRRSCGLTTSEGGPVSARHETSMLKF